MHTSDRPYPVRTRAPLVLATLLAFALAPPPLHAQEIGEVDELVAIAPGVDGFPAGVQSGDDLGVSAARVGDLDGDGVPELAFGAEDDDDGGTNRGAVWILFMTSEGTVASTTKISDTSGGFSAALGNNDRFGRSVAGIGDIDGDGVPDLAVGARRTSDDADSATGNDRGAVWILLLAADGTVKSHVRITEGSGGFTGSLKPNDGFGRSVAAIGDLDGDGTTELAVGADLGWFGEGAVWILFLQPDGQVAANTRIDDSDLGGALAVDDRFGRAVAPLGDRDGNGVPDLAVGAPGDNDGGIDHGSVWWLFLDAAGGVVATAKISDTAGGFTGDLDFDDEFGTALALLDDLDGDGFRELAVGAPGDDDVAADLFGADRGAVWVLFPDAAGNVLSHVKLSEATGGAPALADDAAYGASLANGDLDGDGYGELLAGAPGLAGGGAGWVSFLVVPLTVEDTQPYEGAITTLDGRPGRATLIVIPPDPELPPPPDFIGSPVIVVPKSDGDLVRSQGLDGSTGAGGFSDEGTHPTDENPAEAGAGNFDSLSSGFAGGALTALSDIVTANRGGDSVSVITSNPDGSFDPAVTTPLLTDTAPAALEVGDFDNDGLDDVAVAGASGVTVLLGDGLSGFTTQLFTPVADLTDLSAGFVDDDAFLDLVATSGTLATGPGGESGFATVLLGNGDGSLTNVGTFAAGRCLASVLVGDMTQDGAVDALLTTHEFDAGPGGVPQGRIDLWVGDGAGGFSPSGVFPGHVVPDVGGIHPTYGSLADLDDDGLLDALYTSTSSLAFPFTAFEDQHPPLLLTALVNDGAGGFTVQELGTAYSGKGISAVVEDYSLPKDSVDDVVLVWFEDTLAGTSAPNEEVLTFLAYLENDGSADIFQDATGNQYATGDEPGDGVVADIDGAGADGSTLDIVVPNRAGNSLTILMGAGDGTFTHAPTVTGVDDTVPPGPGWVGGPLAVRFGGENVVDGTLLGFPLVTYNAWRDGSGADPTVLASLSVFDEFGGSYVKVQQLALPRGGTFGQVDMDADGTTDLVVTQSEGAPTGAGSVDLYAGLAPAGLGFATTPVSAAAPAGHALTGGLHVTDCVGSLLPDVVTSSVDTTTGVGHVVVFENVGGALQPGVAWPLGGAWSEIRGLDMGDLTGDGLVDVALGEAEGRLFLAAGQADGSFTPLAAEDVVEETAGGAVALGEISGDGLLDLVSSRDVGGTGLGQAYVRTARGDGAALATLQTVAGLACVDADGRALRPLLGDVDNDSTLELVLVHGASDSVSVFPNAFDTFESYGLSKAGAGGIVPTLTADGYTVTGASVVFEIADGVGGAPSLVQFGTGRAPNLFPAVATVFAQFIVPLSGTPGAPGAGGFAAPAVMPADPAFVGLEFTLQAIVLDPAAGGPAPWGLSVTRGLAFTLVE